MLQTWQKSSLLGSQEHSLPRSGFLLSLLALKLHHLIRQDSFNVWRCINRTMSKRWSTFTCSFDYKPWIYYPSLSKSLGSSIFTFSVNSEETKFINKSRMAPSPFAYLTIRAATLLTDLELVETKLFRVWKPILILNLRFCSEICFILRFCINKISSVYAVLLYHSTAKYFNYWNSVSFFAELWH